MTDEIILKTCRKAYDEWIDYCQNKNPYDDFRFGMPEEFQLALLLIKLSKSIVTISTVESK